MENKFFFHCQITVLKLYIVNLVKIFIKTFQEIEFFFFIKYDFFPAFSFLFNSVFPIFTNKTISIKLLVSSNLVKYKEHNDKYIIYKLYCF